MDICSVLKTAELMEMNLAEHWDKLMEYVVVEGLVDKLVVLKV